MWESDGMAVFQYVEDDRARRNLDFAIHGHEKAECGIKNRALQPVGHGVEADSWRPVL